MMEDYNPSKNESSEEVGIFRVTTPSSQPDELGEKTFRFNEPGAIRTRIAPSPTGFLHVGLARTALFNYLFARKNQGAFVLRIEDTDVERSNTAFEKDIIEGLKWLGIDWTEGPDIEGKYGPYRQSQRLDVYKKYLERLIAEDKAYYCFCSEEELEARRQYQISIGEPPRYSGKCANLPKETVNEYLAQGKPSVIRFRVIKKKVNFDDLIRGRLEFDTSLMGDIVIAKNLNYPLYNFAVVIDDYEMKISHVIRGEEHISNTPKQILIQDALKIDRPKYAHLPLILGTDRTKLSKRHGVLSVSEFKKMGYLPETLVNFMAFLGWNPGEEREIYSLPSLVKEFTLEKVQKAGAIFNIKRLDFLNGFYLRQKSAEKLTELCIPYFIEAGLIEKTGKEPLKPRETESGEGTEKLEIFGEDFEYKIKETKEGIKFETLTKIVSIYQERLKKISEITELTDFFFKDKLKYNKDLLNWDKTTNKETEKFLGKSEKILSKVKAEDWEKKTLESILLTEAEKVGDRGKILWPLRVALTGKEASAGPFEILEILGREKSLKRIKEAQEILK